MRRGIEGGSGLLDTVILEMRKRTLWTQVVWNVITALAFLAVVTPVFICVHDAISWRSSFFNDWEVSKARHPRLVDAINVTRLKDAEPEDLWYPPDYHGWKKCPTHLKSSSTLPEKSNGYLQVFLDGGLNQQRMGTILNWPTKFEEINSFSALENLLAPNICDAVVIAKILNATLVLPHFDMNPVWRDPSIFADVFDVDHFLDYLKNDVHIVLELPGNLSWSSREYYATGVRVTRIKDAPSYSGHMWYIDRVLPILQTHGVAAIAPFTHRLGYEGLPPGIQQLRCRVNFEALRFVPKITNLGDLIIQRLHLNSLEYRVRESNVPRMRNRSSKFLALHLRFDKDMAAHSTCDFGGGVAERRSLAKYRQVMWQGGVPNIQYTKREIRNLGKCPLTPEEVAIMLAALGFDADTHLYLASYKVYGGEARMAHLRKLFPNLSNKFTLATAAELEPFKDKSSQLAALDYHVCLYSDAFISASRGNMHNALLGHRAYEHRGTTIKPDMVLLQQLFANSSFIEYEDFQDRVRVGHQNRMGQLTMRKEMQAIYTYPAPDCMCGPDPR